ncbi:MAG: hypothetical protein J6T22_06315 [Bacteroidales bacterium]|nr:hypothetical protein [Bacteroidales bacterium]
MKHKYYFSILLLAACMMTSLSATAQERTVVQGYCKDENGKVIENVSVYVHDSLLVSVTDEHGRFTYSHAKTGDILRFAHMVFEPTYYTIKEKDINGKNLTVKMKTRSHQLLEVEITANAPHKAYDNPVMTVLDYTIREDGIYLIVYRRRNSALLHLSFDMDTLHEMPISSRYKILNRDAFGDIYALNDYQASLVGFMEYDNDKKGQMNFYYSMPRKEFYEKFSTIVTATDNVFITGWRHFFGTGVSYYRNYLGHDNEPILLHYIEDEEAAASIRRIRGRWEADYIEPVYAPIYAIDNRFYLFAYVDHETLVFDTEGNVLARYPLTFHEYRKWNGKMEPDRRWKQNMLVDVARKEFYTIFVNDGVGTLKRIDLKTGTATAVMDLSGYPFAQNLRIHDGVLYFIYPTGANHRRALYQVRIE